MPDRFGNPTALEVLGALGTERDAIISEGAGGSALDQFTANARAIAMSLTSGADPRLVRAREIEHVFRRVQSSKKQDGESQLDYEIRTGRDAFEAMKNVDPVTAAAISEQLTKMEGLRFERRRLQSDLDRAEAAEARAQEAHDLGTQEARRENLVNSLVYEYDPQTGKLTDDSADLSTQDGRDKVKLWQEERGNAPLSIDSVIDLKLNASDANFKLLGSDQKAMRDVISGAKDAAILARDIANAFADAAEFNINPATKAEGLVRLGQGLITSINEMRRMADPLNEDAPEYGSEQFALDQAALEKALAERGIKTQVPTALLTMYVYATAKSYDPRVTEQDFKNIAGTLGALTGSPAQMVEVIKRQIMGRYESLASDVEPVINNLMENGGADGRSQGKLIGDVWAGYTQYRDEANEAFKRVMTAYGMDEEQPQRRTPPATGERVRVGNMEFDITPGGE